MRADFLKHFDIAELTQPIMVVDHDCISRPITKFEETVEDRFD